MLFIETDTQTRDIQTLFSTLSFVCQLDLIAQDQLDVYLLVVASGRRSQCMLFCRSTLTHPENIQNITS